MLTTSLIEIMQSKPCWWTIIKLKKELKDRNVKFYDFEVNQALLQIRNEKLTVDGKHLVMFKMFGKYQYVFTSDKNLIAANNHLLRKQIHKRNQRIISV